MKKKTARLLSMTVLSDFRSNLNLHDFKMSFQQTAQGMVPRKNGRMLRAIGSNHWGFLLNLLVKMREYTERPITINKNMSRTDFILRPQI